MKRILSLFITFMILLSAFANVSATSDYERELLSALSIMQGDDNGNMRYEDKVSRAECAKIVVATSTHRDALSQEFKSSPFKDVPYTHWASPYITIGVKYGLFKGYLDASFRPSKTVLYEEAITMFLRVLGYSESDFGTDWPYDQIEVAKNIGLLKNINKSVGKELTRRDISAMAYNTLMSSSKGSPNTYLSNFNTISGPKTVLSSNWYEEFGADKTITVTRDGVKSSLSEVNINDIVYYMKEYNTALVYSKKVTGVYESATPNKESPASVTVSGVTYNIEGVDAYSKLSAYGTFKYGDTVTLLLGKTGNVADVLTNEQVSDKVYGFLTATGTKETTVSGTTVTKPYAKIVLPSGEAREYVTNKDYSSILNSVVSVTLEDGVAKISSVSRNNAVSGKFIWTSDSKKIGKDYISDNIKIIEVSSTVPYETSVVASVFPQRLNGTTLSQSSILYVSKNSEGLIDRLILTDTTGDMHTYGIMTNAENTSNQMSISGSYEYISNGNKYSLNTVNKSFSVSSGQAVKIVSDGRSVYSISSLYNAETGKISDISGSIITINGKTYTLSDKVQIYVKKSYEYTMISIDELIAKKENFTASIHKDKQNSDGARVRVIVLS